MHSNECQLYYIYTWNTIIFISINLILANLSKWIDGTFPKSNLVLGQKWCFCMSANQEQDQITTSPPLPCESSYFLHTLKFKYMKEKQVSWNFSSADSHSSISLLRRSLRKTKLWPLVSLLNHCLQDRLWVPSSIWLLIDIVVVTCLSVSYK